MKIPRITRTRPETWTEAAALAAAADDLAAGTIDGGLNTAPFIAAAEALGRSVGATADDRYDPAGLPLDASPVADLLLPALHQIGVDAYRDLAGTRRRLKSTTGTARTGRRHRWLLTALLIAIMTILDTPLVHATVADLTKLPLHSWLSWVAAAALSAVFTVTGVIVAVGCADLVIGHAQPATSPDGGGDRAAGRTVLSSAITLSVLSAITAAVGVGWTRVLTADEAAAGVDTLGAEMPSSTPGHILLIFGVLATGLFAGFTAKFAPLVADSARAFVVTGSSQDTRIGAIESVVAETERLSGYLVSAAKIRDLATAGQAAFLRGWCASAHPSATEAQKVVGATTVTVAQAAWEQPFRDTLANWIGTVDRLALPLATDTSTDLLSATPAAAAVVPMPPLVTAPVTLPHQPTERLR